MESIWYLGTWTLRDKLTLVLPLCGFSRGSPKETAQKGITGEPGTLNPTWRPGGLSKSVIRRVIIGGNSI